MDIVHTDSGLEGSTVLRSNRYIVPRQIIANDLLFKLHDGDFSKVLNYADDNSLLSIGATPDCYVQFEMFCRSDAYLV